MKLGKLLLRNFSRASSRKKSKPKPRPSTREPAPFVARSARPRSAPRRAPSKPTLPARKPRSVEEVAESAVLTTFRMIRPDERLRTAIEGFLLDQRSEHTRRAYQKDLKRFVKYLVTRRYGREEAIERIDRAMLIAYKEFLLAEKLEHTSIDRHLATLRSFFGWLEQEGIIAKNPAEGVRFLNPRKLSTTQGLSDEDVRKILEVPDLHTRTGALHYAILVVLLHAGLRRSELCALRTSQLGRERGHDVVRLMGKGNKERIIPLQSHVVSAIRHYARMERKDLSADQPLFTPVRNNRTGDHDKPLDSSAIYYIVVKYARLAGIRNRISPHSCRATAISNARDRQAPDRAIQEFAGWASTEMITRYDKRRTAVEKSAALLIDYGERDRTAAERAPEAARDAATMDFAHERPALPADAGNPV